METFILVIILALITYMVFTFKTGMARGKYEVSAPAVTGHATFERYYRVQQNTLEQLIVFLPAMFAFAYLAESRGWAGYFIASGLGVVWIVGRILYARTYVKDPTSRLPGFLLTFIPSAIMIASSVIMIVLDLLKG